MIKYNWDITKEEKSRIINLHENATKNQYIKEQVEKKTVYYSYSLLPEKRPGSIVGTYSDNKLFVDFGDGNYMEIPSKQEIESGATVSDFEKITNYINELGFKKIYIPTYQKDNLGVSFLWMECVIKNGKLYPSNTGLTYKV